ncbi:MAG: hypothetical protein MZV70_01865 [Desulfobacterales bacterium]|nr:hypothetical protein [Desulfobacterales bacterium]
MTYTTKAFSVDELGFIQTALTRVLAAVSRGEVDLNRLAREELAVEASTRRAFGSDSSGRPPAPAGHSHTEGGG